MAVPVVLSDFDIVNVTAPVAQDELKPIQAHFMTIAQCAARGITDPAERQRVAQALQDRMARYGTSSEYIAQRQVSVLTSCFVKNDPQNAIETIARYGDLRSPTGETLDERMNLFEEVACDVFDRVYSDPNAAAPDDIVHVSCSGYVSPSPVQTFLSRRGWLNVGVTHSYHMGCYGAFPAIRTALGLVGSSYSSLPERKRRVDLVHTEFLSLHFDLLGDEPDNFVTSTLFADGFIKYSASPLAEFSKRGASGLKILAIDEHILPDSLPEMTLRPGPLQFDMSLSKRVPFMIRDSIADFVRSICGHVGLDFEREKAAMIFAIHPGGPAILNQIRGRLGIEESAVAMSRRVLYEHGNMASATAPHIWKLILESPEIPAGSKILSMAFGPGLTVIGALFEKV
jgi:predicted naringenin-chalcone synthase